MHFRELLGREHVRIGEEELQFGSAFDESIFLKLVKKLESSENVIFLQ